MVLWILWAMVLFILLLNSLGTDYYSTLWALAQEVVGSLLARAHIPLGCAHGRRAGGGMRWVHSRTRANGSLHRE